MPYKKDRSYRDVPFSSETPREDFFLYDPVSNLYTKCESNKNKIIKIRTVGVLRNKNGTFYIKEMITTHAQSIPPDPRQRIQVSMAYLNRPMCSTMSYPVQLFGKLQWCNHPVIFAQIIQPLSVSVAPLLYETMARVSTFHSCSLPMESQDVDQWKNQNLSIGSES